MPAWLALSTLLALGAGDPCVPQPPDAVAELERRAADAERKADNLDSEAVRSGNTGAARRAEQARADAVDARRRAALAACRPAPPPPVRKPGSGY